jgi:hypothetical protein
MNDELLAALADVWDAIRARHEDVPPVVLVVGTNPRLTTRRRTVAHFAPAGWLPPAPRDSGRLYDGLDAIDEGIQAAKLVWLSGARSQKRVSCSSSHLRYLPDWLKPHNELSATERWFRSRLASMVGGASSPGLT